MSVRGLVSIGTNSTRALVAEIGQGDPKTLLHRSVGTRIGEGLRERGHLEEAAMQRTLDAIAEHAAAIHEFTTDLRVIATSALRRADNEPLFVQRVHALVKCDVDIISGEEEAACSFVGALSGVHAGDGERFGVLDVGGGSSEYAVGTKARPEQSVSCEIGAVRLTERFPALSGAHAPVPPAILQQAAGYAERMLAPALALQHVDRLVLVGGSATTTVSLVRERRELFSYAKLSIADVRSWLARLARTGLEERRTLPGMNPQRADILLAGLLLVERFLSATAHGESLVSTSDVLLGYLLRHPPASSFR